MPELPEVETVRRQLEPHLIGKTITATWSTPSPKFSDVHDSLGFRIETLNRRGKYLIADLVHPELHEERQLVLHLGMTGKLRVISEDDATPLQYLPVLSRPSPSLTATGESGVSTPGPYVRATLELDEMSVLEFDDVRQFGRLRVVAPYNYVTMPTLHDLGPDPFEEAFTPEHLRTYVHQHRQAIKTQLLSQRPVAGLGNIYVDEALWMSKVHPLSTEITIEQSVQLHEAIQEVLSAAIQHGGTTIRDYVSVDGESGQYQFALHCYGRAGEPCERCNTSLDSRVIGGRTSTFCPMCQQRRWRRRS